MQPSNTSSAEVAATAMAEPTPAAAQTVSVTAAEFAAAAPVAPAPTGGGGGGAPADTSGIYRSLEVQDDSKTPYSDATQVREKQRGEESACAFAIAPVRRRDRSIG